MFGSLRQMHDEVLAALQHNARAANLLLERLSSSPRLVRRGPNSSGRSSSTEGDS